MRYKEDSRNNIITSKYVFYFFANIIFVFVMLYLLITSSSARSIQFSIMIVSCLNILYLCFRKLVKSDNISTKVLILFILVFVFSSINYISRL